MADRDGGVGVFRLLAEDGSHRFSDDVAATEDDDFGAVGIVLRTTSCPLASNGMPECNQNKLPTY